jgi:hypothetical protein
MMSSPEVPRELAEPRGEPAPALGSGRSKVLAGEADSVPVAQRLAEDADLAMSLAALSRLSSGRLGLEDLLTEVAAGAVRAIPGAEGAGLTLLETDRGDTIVKTARSFGRSTTSSTGWGRARASARPTPAARCGPGRWVWIGGGRGSGPG